MFSRNAQRGTIRLPFIILLTPLSNNADPQGSVFFHSCTQLPSLRPQQHEILGCMHPVEEENSQICCAVSMPIQPRHLNSWSRTNRMSTTAPAVTYWKSSGPVFSIIGFDYAQWKIRIRTFGNFLNCWVSRRAFPNHKGRRWQLHPFSCTATPK